MTTWKDVEPVYDAVDDARLAGLLATQAGRLLNVLRAESFTAGMRGGEVGRCGDRVAHEFLARTLARARPGDAVLSEEAADTDERLTADRVWIIDPLDGTVEYGMPGRADWAVHVALWESAVGISAAAVAQPAIGETLVSDRLVPARRTPPARLRMLVSASRPADFTDEVAAAVGAEVVRMGSAGAKTMTVLRGDAEAYLHAGGQWEWDSAAPVGLALAAGLHASRIDGSALRYNRRNPRLPDLLICLPEYADALLAAVRAAGGAP